MDVYYLIVFFIFGLVFGSFFNVVGYRLPNKMSLIDPPSHCTKCNHRLTPLELVPVFSWLFQRGKCKNCGCKISIFYPIFELATGISFSLIYYVFGLSIDTFIALLFTSMILILIISDVLYMIILDEILIFFGSIIFITKIIYNGIDIIIPTLIDMLIPFIVMLLIKLLGDYMFKRESLGFGDIKLMLVFGLVLGWEVSLLTIVLAAFLALPISLITIKSNKSHEIPLGPYLGIAAFLCLILRVDSTIIMKFLGF